MSVAYIGDGDVGRLVDSSPGVVVVVVVVKVNVSSFV